MQIRFNESSHVNIFVQLFGRSVPMSNNEPTESIYHIDADVPDYIRAAISNASRPTADRNFDRHRKPAELLHFSGIRPGDRVADVMPGRGYLTRIFQRSASRDRGRVFSIYPTLIRRRQAGERRRDENTCGRTALREYVVEHPADREHRARRARGFRVDFAELSRCLWPRHCKALTAASAQLRSGVQGAKTRWNVHRDRSCGKSRPRRPRREYASSHRSSDDHRTGEGCRIRARGSKRPARESRRQSHGAGFHRRAQRAYGQIRSEVSQAARDPIIVCHERRGRSAVISARI